MTSFRKILSIECWPELDRLAWEAARQPGDPFSPAGGAAHWSAKTCRQIVKSYGRWLQYLRVTDQLDAEAPPAARALEPTLRDFVVVLRQEGLASETLFSALRNLREVLRVMDPAAISAC